MQKFNRSLKRRRTRPAQRKLNNGIPIRRPRFKRFVNPRFKRSFGRVGSMARRVAPVAMTRQIKNSSRNREVTFHHRELVTSVIGSAEYNVNQ